MPQVIVNGQQILGNPVYSQKFYQRFNGEISWPVVYTISEIDGTGEVRLYEGSQSIAYAVSADRKNPYRAVDTLRKELAKLLRRQRKFLVHAKT